jgi:hypothetical protein
VAHAQDDKDDQTGAVKIVPLLPGSAKNTLPSIPDIIAYMGAEVDDKGVLHRVLYMESSERLVSGNRFGLPGRLVDPSMKKIIDQINGGNA